MQNKCVYTGSSQSSVKEFQKMDHQMRRFNRILADLEFLTGYGRGSDSIKIWISPRAAQNCRVANA